jgi:hypothetical protein
MNVQETNINVQRKKNMARIPFELNEGLKEEFEKRLKSFDLPSYQRLSTSQLLRAFTALVITMDNKQLSDLLVTTNRAEGAIENYLDLCNKYGMGNSFDPVPEIPFEKRYLLMLDVESGLQSKESIESVVRQIVLNRDKTAVGSIKAETNEILRSVGEKNLYIPEK